jgi:hypothetical protein
MTAITESFIARGDLAHLALLVWAVSASALLVVIFRAAQDASERSAGFMREFLQELARFNRKIEGDDA